MKKVLVVGTSAHTGLIGKAVCDILDKHGHENVIIISKEELEQKSAEEIEEFANNIKSIRDIEPIELELTARPSFEDYKYSAKELNSGHRRPYKYHR